MSFDFSTLITDRTYADVSRVQELSSKIRSGTASESDLAEFNSADMKGAYNHTDLNRVTAAMEALKAKLEGYGYNVPGYQRIKVPHVLPEPEPTSRLPEGYMELTYIESTGTQHIDMGVKPNQNTRVEAVLDVTTNTTSTLGVLGCRATTSGNYFALWEIDGVFKWQYEKQTIPSGVTAYGRHTVTVDKLGIVVDGALTPATEGSINCNYNMLLFAINTGGTADSRMVSAKFYSCRIYDNGTLVRDYVPCINPSGEVGLYDLVTAAFFGNSGTGAFIASPIPRKLPDGYTQVEYIQSSAPNYTSGQRIDTKFVPNSNTRVVCDFQFTTTTSSFQALLGSRSSSANRFCLWLTNGGLFRSDYNASNISFPSSLSATERHTLDFNKNVCTIDGSVVTHSAGTFNGVCNLFLFASDTDGSADIHGNVRIFACHIYDNGTLVRDYVPCKNSGGVFGLYDIANDVFYQNAGSGAFTAGAEVAAPATASVAVVSDAATEYDPHTWYEFDWPTPATMTVYVLNVAALRSVFAVMASTPAVPSDMVGLMVEEANNIEKILVDINELLIKSTQVWFYSGELFAGEV